MHVLEQRFAHFYLLHLFTRIAFSPIRRLVGNPVCSDPEFSNRFFCSLQQDNLITYTTSVTQCGSTSCSSDQSLDPATCSCAYPYTGKMVFRAPSFTDLSGSTNFQQLETSLWEELGLSPHAVLLSDVHLNSDDYLQVQVSLFPSTGASFNQSELINLGSDLSKQIYKPPQIFGPYYFIADQYTSFPAGIKITSMQSLLIVM